MSPVSSLIDVFSRNDGSAIFGGLVSGTSGSAGALAKVGWIFTAFGAAFVLWGFVLRAEHVSSDDRVGEIAKTWIIFGLMMGAPFLMRASMESADGVYSSAIGGPDALALACVKAAYALPNPLVLSDGKITSGAPPVATTGVPASGSTSDGSIYGFLVAQVYSQLDSAFAEAEQVKGVFGTLEQLCSLGSGFFAAIARNTLILVSFVCLHLLFLASSGIVWFMEQIRFFLALVGTMMMPLFIGMLSLPSGHPNRQAAHGYLTNMVSLALWPVSWTIGHTGTIVLFDLLVSLIAGTARTPAIVQTMGWSALTSGNAIDTAQLKATEVAVGNLYLGDIAPLAAILVAAVGFAIWVFVVSIAGPVLLHRTITTGALFVSQAASSTGQFALSATSFAITSLPTTAGQIKGLFAAAKPAEADPKQPGMQGTGLTAPPISGSKSSSMEKAANGGTPQPDTKKAIGD